MMIRKLIFTLFLALISIQTFSGDLLKKTELSIESSINDEGKEEKKVGVEFEVNSLKSKRIVGELEKNNKKYLDLLEAEKEQDSTLFSLTLRIDSWLRVEKTKFLKRQKARLSILLKMLKPQVLKGQSSAIEFLKVKKEHEYVKAELARLKLQTEKYAFTFPKITEIRKKLSTLSNVEVKSLSKLEYQNEKLRYDLTKSEESKIISGIEVSYQDKDKGWDRGIGVSLNIPFGQSHQKSKAQYLKTKTKEYKFHKENRERLYSFDLLKKEAIGLVSEILNVDLVLIKDLKSLVKVYKKTKAKSGIDLLKLQVELEKKNTELAEKKAGLYKKYFELKKLSGVLNEQV